MTETARLIGVPAEFAAQAKIDADGYARLYEESVASPEASWVRQARERLTWYKEWDQVVEHQGFQPDDALRGEAIETVADSLSKIARPDVIHWSNALPKTRSGKIRRRILRKIAEAEYDSLGNTSTLAEPSAVEQLVAERRTLDI